MPGLCPGGGGGGGGGWGGAGGEVDGFGINWYIIPTSPRHHLSVLLCFLEGAVNGSSTTDIHQT